MRDDQMGWCLLLSIFLAVSCGGENIVTFSNGYYNAENVNKKALDKMDSVSYSQIGRIVNNQIMVENNVDLKEKMCLLPYGYKLCAKGGIIKNGVLVGNSTKIEGNLTLFDKVIIRGTWNVSKISTSMFFNLDYDNSLKDVVALANPDVKNTIVIENGEYKVRSLKNGDVCISICSNTDFILNGTIKLVANNYSHYNIIQAQGHHITIRGNGSVIGDKFTHTGTTGEWGMGIRFHKAIDSSVEGLKIKECWGDCIYIGRNSKNIIIDKCILDNGRRQGVSITSANNISIRNCLIKDVKGTNPEFAIDVEPNRGDTVNNVIIENVKIVNCEGGIKATKSKIKPNLFIGNIIIKRCQIASKRKYPVLFDGCETATIKNSLVVGTNNCSLIYALNCGHVSITDNNVIQNKHIQYSAKNVVKSVMKGLRLKPILIDNVLSQNVKGNEIIEQ